MTADDDALPILQLMPGRFSSERSCPAPRVNAKSGSAIAAVTAAQPFLDRRTMARHGRAAMSCALRARGFHPRPNDRLFLLADRGQLWRVERRGQPQILVVRRLLHHEHRAARHGVRRLKEAAAVPRVTPPVAPDDVGHAGAWDVIPAAPQLEPADARRHAEVLLAQRRLRRGVEGEGAPRARQRREGVQRLRAALVPPRRAGGRAIAWHPSPRLRVLRRRRGGAARRRAGGAVVPRGHARERADRVGVGRGEESARGVDRRAGQCAGWLGVVDLRDRLERLGHPVHERVGVRRRGAQPERLGDCRRIARAHRRVQPPHRRHQPAVAARLLVHPR
eukprot:CAMPEP_0205892932 /NCGR_PEP_ID=MMETSP1083-20121108/22960_1 /ASSEMBLY_ACC=CAM_ASM_000430 /TAXON_ID=97485 /ORGANISM="Prymnesium parvum, Strain Texoma1" /LENGTH=334 /DNA_ID=CAMNT_0053257523 /DNA_START=259 /DNA_END=1260 /DNA_ORIENTATION=+